MTLYQPVSVPVWNGSTTNEVLTASDTSFQSLTVPAGATAVLLSSLGAVDFFVSPVTTSQSGIRVGGVSSHPLLVRLGTSPTIRVKGTAGGGELIGALYFYGQPPGGGLYEAVDVPLWDNAIRNAQFSNAAGATSRVFLPPTDGFFSLSVVEDSSAQAAVSFVSTEDTDDTGLRIGGATGSWLMHRFDTPRVLQRGVATGNDTGDDLIDSGGAFTDPAKNIAVGNFIYNVTDGSYGVITAIDTATTISHTQLVHGSGNDWERFVDRYVIYEGIPLFVHNPDATVAVDVGLLVFSK